MAQFEPTYLRLLASGAFEARIEQAYAHLEKCDLCPWRCGVDRLAGKRGVCFTGKCALVSSYGPHMGEERPLSGWRGSGTIFFARCNMRCQFCQNSDISQGDAGEEVEPEALAAIMLELQSLGCHNINFVSPSHVIPQIMAAVRIAALNGLRLPLVYNTGGYDALTALQLLEDVIDIYMPDMKYASAQIGLYYSKTRDYPGANQTAVREMHRQVGDLAIDDLGLAQRGLLVRHLVLPHNLAGSAQVLRFIAEQISPNTYLNLMDQYRPAFNARRFPKLNRPITQQEFRQALEIAAQYGLTRLDRV